MSKYPNIKKVYTENPLIDEIIYECKQIIQGIVLKDENEANKNETEKSMRDADIYKEIQYGTATYGMFEYTYETFMKIPSMTPEMAIRYANKILPVPEGIKPQLQKIASEKWVANYQDTNNYYRKLQGLPNVGDPYIYLTEEDLLKLPVESYDIWKPVHQCTAGEAELLYTTGIIDSLKERYPEAKYLDHLGDRSIPSYLAREAENFSILYLPPVDSPEVSNKWKERFEINRVYVLKAVYSDAYKYQSDYYDRFMMILIVCMTLEDMVTYSPEYIISRELFDLRTIEFIFNICGVEFFPEIPLKYQKRLVKNLNRLIKYKSSNKCMVDIVSLFGFENMELFSYYLMKTPVTNSDGSYRKDTYTDPDTGKEVLDLEADYKLQFLKVPLDEAASDYIDNPLNRLDYDEIVKDDVFWNGIYTKEYVKHTILEHEFSLRKSKYISVDTVYSLTEMQFELVYFINMLLYSNVNSDKLLVDVPEISMSKKFKLVDLIIALYSLMYLYNDTKDSIIYDPVKAMAVYGFNFETDISELSTYLAGHGFKLKDVGLERFKNPNPSGFTDWDDFITTYRNNKEIYDNLVNLMNNANCWHEYQIYRKIYQSLYVTKINFAQFQKSSIYGRAPSTYLEYLKYQDGLLYTTILDSSNIAKDSERQLEISRIINFIVEDIYSYIDEDEFKYIFQHIPTVSMDYIRQYIFKVLNFFKSYTVDLIHTNILYKFDDKLNNKIYIIDRIMMHYIFTKRDNVNMADCAKLLVHLNPKEYYPICEKIYLDITYWVKLFFKSTLLYTDRWSELLIHMTKIDYVNIQDDKIGEYSHVYDWKDYIESIEQMNTTIKTTKTDIFNIMDKVSLAITTK